MDRASARRDGGRGALRRSAYPPRPPLPPRRDLVVGDDEDVRVLVHGRARSASVPIAWDEAANDPVSRGDLHAMQWIEALDDRRFATAVLDWIARGNGAGSKGAREAFDVEATSIRCATWMQQVAVRAHRLPVEFVDGVVRSVAQQVRRLDAALRRLDVVMRAEGLGRVLWRRGGRSSDRAAVLLEGARTLCWAGRFFEGREAENWIRHGERLLARALSRAFLADGVHVRRDPVSHARACVTLLECRIVLGNHAVVHDLEAAIGKAC